RTDLRAKGIEPEIACSGWTLPGEVAFYCDGQPTVHNFGVALGTRWSQYDLWRPNPIWEPAPFLGKTFIFVGERVPDLVAAFDEVGEEQTVTHFENEYSVASWHVITCRGFRGFGGAHSLRPSRY